MSNLVLGTVQFGLDYGINNSVGKPSLEDCKQITDTFLEQGFFEFDTAQGYGDSEQVLSKVLNGENRKFKVHSKFIFDENDLKMDLDTYINKSLSNLKVERLGFFFFHRFSDFEMYYQKNIKPSALIEEKSEGLAVSIYDEEEFELALKANFIKAIQLPVNIFDCSKEKLLLLKKAKEQNVKIYCRSVYLQGLFFMEPSKLPPKLKPFASYINSLNIISQNYKIDKSVLALAFVRKISEIDGVLIGVETNEQLISNINAWKESLSVNSEALKLIENLQFPDKELLLPKNWK